MNLRIVDKNISITPIGASDTAKAYTHKLDPTDFKAAITNMLDNAVEHMANGLLKNNIYILNLIWYPCLVWQKARISLK